MKLGNPKFHSCTIFLQTKELYILDPFLAFRGTIILIIFKTHQQLTQNNNIYYGLNHSLQSYFKYSCKGNTWNKYARITSATENMFYQILGIQKEIDHGKLKRNKKM